MFVSVVSQCSSDDRPWALRQEKEEFTLYVEDFDQVEEGGRRHFLKLLYCAERLTKQRAAFAGENGFEEELYGKKGFWKICGIVIK